MKQSYRALGFKLGSWECVTLSNRYDHALSGKYGEIWPAGDGVHYKGFVVVNRKYEKLIRFHEKDLNKWRVKLNIPLDPKEQEVWANDPNRRLD